MSANYLGRPQSRDARRLSKTDAWQGPSGRFESGFRLTVDEWLSISHGGATMGSSVGRVGVAYASVVGITEQSLVVCGRVVIVGHSWVAPTPRNGDATNAKYEVETQKPHTLLSCGRAAAVGVLRLLASRRSDRP